MTDHDSNWVTIREGALALGVSELTVRRRIKDGRIAHRLVNGKYFINLQSTPHPASRDDQAGVETGRRSGPLPDPIDHSSQSTHLVGGREVPPIEPDEHQAAAGGTRGNGAVVGPGPLPFDLDALLAEHARLAEIAGRARLLEEQYAELSARHEELRAGMLSLAGRNGWLESKLEERESEIKLLTDEQPRPSWWKRLFGA